jgi:dihydropteroate synthase type 2
MAPALKPCIFGILNITEDSFSDAGRYLDPDAAVTHGRALLHDGADVIDLGAASSNPDAKPLAPEVEIGRLAPVVEALSRDGAKISIDTFAPEVQRWALVQGIDYLNDVRGFPDPELYPLLADSNEKLIVMHAVQEGGPASRSIRVPATELPDRIISFFEHRIATLAAAGVARERLILDPGMGLFLGTDAEGSFTVLRNLPRLKQVFGLPVLVSVSRKSFLRRLTGRGKDEAGAVSLAAELFAALQGADHIRTHEPAPLKDGLAVWRNLIPETDRNPP